jgi:hypothetical protein
MPSTRRTDPVIVYYSNPDNGDERCFCKPSKTSKKHMTYDYDKIIGVSKTMRTPNKFSAKGADQSSGFAKP